MSTYPYKTAPFQWQRDCLNLSAVRRAFAVLSVPGVGKTKEGLDNAGFLYLGGKIDTLLILAPNGVHKGWLVDQVQEHLTDAIENVELYIWESGASTATRWKRMREAQLAVSDDAFVIVAVNTEAITAQAHKFIMSLLRTRRSVMTIVDESNDIASPSAKRTRRAWAYGKLSAYRRIFTGTLGDDAVMDLYAQFRFLDWRIIGCSTYKEFKERYAEWVEVEARGRQFSVIKKDATGKPVYKNLDELRAKIALHSFRVTEANAGIDLPPISYAKWYFDLTPEQWRLYKELERDYQVQYGADEEMTADLRVVRDTRLQQLTNGYVTTDGGEPTRVLDIAAMPRLDAAMKVIDHYPGKMIIWARWQLDVTLLMERLAHLGAVRYDGQVGDAERARNKRQFIEDPSCRFFIANPAAAGRGLDGLQIVPTVLFYSNYFRYVTRRQAEKRAHRAGAKLPVTVVDLVASKTIDELRIIPRLRAKNDVHDFMTGDPSNEWI